MNLFHKITVGGSTLTKTSGKQVFIECLYSFKSVSVNLLVLENVQVFCIDENGNKK